MRPVTKSVLVYDRDGAGRSLKYEVEYKVHPEFENMSVSDLKKIFNFSEGESVPDCAHVIVLGETELTDEELRHVIAENELMDVESVIIL